MTKKERKPRAPKFTALVEKHKNRIKAEQEEQSACLAMADYLAGLGKYANKTVGKFFDAIEKDGAKEVIMGLEVAQVFGPMFAGRKGKKGGKKVVAAGGRLTRAENEKIQAQILDYLKANPDSNRKEIGKALKVPTKRLFSPMKALLAQKKLATKGVRAGMRYSVK